MTDEHQHVYNWERDGDDSVHKCSCGAVQARLENAYDDDE